MCGNIVSKDRQTNRRDFPLPKERYLIVMHPSGELNVLAGYIAGHEHMDVQRQV